MCTIITIIEIVLVVFVTEERGHLYPYKFCFRYLAPLLVPYMIMFLKCEKKEIKPSRSVISICTVIFVYLIWYYIKQGTKLASIDAPFLFMIQKTDNDLIHGFNKVFISIFTLVVLTTSVLWKLNKIKNIKKTYIILFMTAIILSFPVNCFWHLRQSNSDTMGKVLKGDFIKVADFLKRDYDKVYILKIPTGENECVRRIYAYLITDYELLEPEDNKTIDIDNKNIAVIVSKDFNGNLTGVKKTEIMTDKIDVYTSDKESKELIINMN